MLDRDYHDYKVISNYLLSHIATLSEEHEDFLYALFSILAIELHLRRDTLRNALEITSKRLTNYKDSLYEHSNAAHSEEGKAKRFLNHFKKKKEFYHLTAQQKGELNILESEKKFCLDSLESYNVWVRSNILNPLMAIYKFNEAECQMFTNMVFDDIEMDPIPLLSIFDKEYHLDYLKIHKLQAFMISIVLVSLSLLGYTREAAKNQIVYDSRSRAVLQFLDSLAYKSKMARPGHPVSFPENLPFYQHLSSSLPTLTKSKSISLVDFDFCSIEQLVVWILKEQLPTESHSSTSSPKPLDELNYEQIVADIKETKEDEAEKKESAKARKKKRMLWTGLGALGGGIILGVTGGLAAPLILPAVLGLVGISVGGILVGATGAAVVGSLFGAAGAGLTGYKVNKRLADISDFGFLLISNPEPSIVENMNSYAIISSASNDDSLCNAPEMKKPSMSAFIAVSGWISNEDDLVNGWKFLASGARTDVYSLKFEPKVLINLNNSMKAFITDQAVGIAAAEVIKKTVLAGAAAALAWPLGILQLGNLIDNPWSLAFDRAKKAGIVLADVLHKRIQGNRPISLVGFSLGALVIYTALEELCKKPEPPVGLIEDVVLLGLPASTLPNTKWANMRCLVAGRFVNGYTSSDWILQFLFRASEISKKNSIAGINPIPDVESLNIESIELSNIVEGHLDYGSKLNSILDHIGYTGRQHFI